MKKSYEFLLIEIFPKYIFHENYFEVEIELKYSFLPVLQDLMYQNFPRWLFLMVDNRRGLLLSVHSVLSVFLSVHRIALITKKL